MKSVWYCRERRTPPVVEITFEPGWKAVTVLYKGEALGVPAGRPELEAGRTYTARDGSELTVRLPRRAAFPEVDLNGKRLLLTVGDPVKVARTAFGVVLFIGIINTAGGALALVSGAEAVRGLGASGYNLIYGVIFLALSALVYRGSVVGLAAAVALYAASSGWWLYASKSAGAPIPTAAVVVRGLVLLFLLWVLHVLWQTTPRRDAPKNGPTEG